MSSTFATVIMAVISTNGLKEHDGQNICCGASVHMMETAPFSLIYYVYQYMSVFNVLRGSKSGVPSLCVQIAD